MLCRLGWPHLCGTHVLASNHSGTPGLPPLLLASSRRVWWLLVDPIVWHLLC
jgi:hypothetical protein